MWECFAVNRIIRRRPQGCSRISEFESLYGVKLDKRGFESPTQFYVVIPGHAEPELSCLVDKSDGKHTHLAFVIGVCLTNSAVMVCG